MYVSHVYSGGANCHLTGQPRTAEVRYTCLRDTHQNMVLSVREFPTCNYVVVVATPFVCKHPQFTPPVSFISCQQSWLGSVSGHESAECCCLARDGTVFLCLGVPICSSIGINGNRMNAAHAIAVSTVREPFLVSLPCNAHCNAFIPCYT